MESAEGSLSFFPVGMSAPGYPVLWDCYVLIFPVPWFSWNNQLGTVSWELGELLEEDIPVPHGKHGLGFEIWDKPGLLPCAKSGIFGSLNSTRKTLPPNPTPIQTVHLKRSKHPLPHLWMLLELCPLLGYSLSIPFPAWILHLGSSLRQEQPFPCISVPH